MQQDSLPAHSATPPPASALMNGLQQDSLSAHSAAADEAAVLLLARLLLACCRPAADGAPCLPHVCVTCPAGPQVAVCQQLQGAAAGGPQELLCGEQTGSSHADMHSLRIGSGSAAGAAGVAGVCNPSCCSSELVTGVHASASSQPPPHNRRPVRPGAEQANWWCWPNQEGCQLEPAGLGRPAGRHPGCQQGPG